MNIEIAILIIIIVLKLGAGMEKCNACYCETGKFGMSDIRWLYIHTYCDFQPSIYDCFICKFQQYFPYKNIKFSTIFYKLLHIPALDQRKRLMNYLCTWKGCNRYIGNTIRTLFRSTITQVSMLFTYLEDYI